MGNPPSHEQVKVATDTLRTEAGHWDDQSSKMNAASLKVGQMAFGRLEAGLFQLLVEPYNEVISAVEARCGEAVTAMTEVGTTLRKVADIYDAEDVANEHRIRNIY